MGQKILFFLLFFLACTWAAQAQTRQLRGKVTDEASKSLPGVSIVIKGKQQGTVTDVDGQYNLPVSQTGPVTLTFSFVGYQSQEIEVGGRSELDVALKPEDNALSEVVVVGYGTQKKSDLTGAISSIGSREVAGRQTIQISEALQGSIAGVSVTRSSGAPGAGSNILIRGITTIGTNNPLVIVDGVPVSSIDNVNPGDVENISVLKDAASASIYGSRGAAGVILVSTKRASQAKAALNTPMNMGCSAPLRAPNMWACRIICAISTSRPPMTAQAQARSRKV